MMRFLLINLAGLLLLSSCSLKTYEGLRTTLLMRNEVRNSYFANSNTDYVYKAKIDVYGNYFGGILIIKKVNTNSHRVVFTTEFGSKIFDFLYEGDTFTKNFVIDDLDKKLLVNTLRKDFKLLITENAKVVSQFVSEDYDVFKAESQNRLNFYYFYNEGKSLDKIIHTSRYKKKITFIFHSDTPDVAQKIEIDHSNIKLKIELNYFKKN